MGTVHPPMVYAGSNSTLTVINALTNQVVTSIPMGGNVGCGAAAVDTINHFLYYAAGTTIYQLDERTNQITASYPLGTGTPRGMAVNPISNKVYVANWTSGSTYIWMIDTSNSTVSTIDVGAQPILTEVNSLTGTVYVSLIANEIAIVDGNSNTRVGTITVPATTAHGLTVDPIRQRLWATFYSSTSTVNVIDTTNNTIIATITVGTNLNNLNGNLLTNRFYATSYNSTNFFAIDGDNAYSVTTITVAGIQGETPAVNPFSIMLRNSIPANLVYVALGGGTQVSVVDQTTNQQIATILVDGAPRWTVVDPFIN
jgi:YVTN family beta-propeller protein